MRSARRVGTRLPIHVIVGPERDEKKEAALLKHGVHVTAGPFIRPPVWANKYHRLAFGKIGALSLVQFDKVFVFDNDMALAHNIDHLAHAPTPSAVWHTTMARWQWRHNETCAVTTGLLGLQPSRQEYARALAYLYAMPNRSTYDGGDQEFWRHFYTWNELPVCRQRSLDPVYECTLRTRPSRPVRTPRRDEVCLRFAWVAILHAQLRYQAHQALNMPHAEWKRIRVLHSISGLREVNRMPKDMRSLIKYFY